MELTIKFKEVERRGQEMVKKADLNSLFNLRCIYFRGLLGFLVDVCLDLDRVVCLVVRIIMRLMDGGGDGKRVLNFEGIKV